MPDMLVKLYELPDVEPILAAQQEKGVTIRRAKAPEKIPVVNWVAEHFGSRWASETDIGFARQPISTFIALENDQLLGFACHDTSCKNFFGPTGVLEVQQGRGIGKALLLICLQAMWEQGYAYAIIGGVGPAKFYTKVVGAILIEDSSPGIYGGLLPQT